jgi:hypothetical protein
MGTVSRTPVSTASEAVVDDSLLLVFDTAVATELFSGLEEECSTGVFSLPPPSLLLPPLSSSSDSWKAAPPSMGLQVLDDAIGDAMCLVPKTLLSKGAAEVGDKLVKVVVDEPSGSINSFGEDVKEAEAKSVLVP